MAGIGGVVVQFRATADQAIRETKKFVRGLDGVDGAAKRAGSGLKKGLAVGAVAAGAAVAGVGAALINFGEAAIADAASAGRLAKTLRNVTKASDEQVDSLESWITQQGIAKGVADDELRPALARLVRSTKDVTKAQELASLAIDISAATGKDYQTVATGLAKANDGQVTALRKLGITLGESAENAILYEQAMDRLLLTQNDAKAAFEEYGPASKQYKAAMDRVATAQGQVNALASSGVDWQKELTKEFKGQGEEQANSVEGTWKQIKLIFTEAQESLGGVVLAPLERLAEWFKDPKHIEEAEDFLNDLGDAAYSAGEDFVQWVDTTLVPAIERVYAWFQSADGQQAIKDWTGYIKALGKAIETTTGYVGPLVDKLSTLFDWLSKIPGPFMAVERILKWAGGGGDPKPAPSSSAVKPTKRSVGPSYTNSKGVTVNIYNPKAERSAESAALALRITRTGRGK